MVDKEILSIEWHTCDLMVKALNATATVNQACRVLGISERTIYRSMSIYNIIYNPDIKTYKAYRIPKYTILKVNED